MRTARSLVALLLAPIVASSARAAAPSSVTPSASASVSASVTPSASASAGISASSRVVPPASTLRAMSLAEALAYAHAHQLQLKVAEARIAAAKVAAKIPDAQWLPQIGAVAELFGGTANNSTDSYIGDPTVDIPRIGGTATTSSWSLRPYASSFVGVGATQEVFDFGRIAAARVAVESVIDLEKYRAKADLLDVDLLVREAFFAVQGGKQISDAADAAYARAKIHRDFAKAAIDQDLRPRIELTRAEADLTRFDVGRMRALGAIAIARSVLAAAIGAPDDAIDATDARDATRATDATDATDSTSPMPSLEGAVTGALDRDPVLKEALAEVASQEAAAKAIAAEARPSFFLSALVSGRAGGAPASGVGFVPDGAGLLPDVPNWQLGLVLRWPIYDGVIGARHDAALARKDEAVAEVELHRARQIGDIRRAYYAARIAEATMPALARALEAAKENYVQAETRFRGGLATSVEVADAEALLSDAEVQLALGRFERSRTRAVFARTIAEGA